MRNRFFKKKTDKKEMIKNRVSVPLSNRTGQFDPYSGMDDKISQYTGNATLPVD